MRAHAYGLLRTILGTAVADDVIASNPCRIRGAGQATRARQIRPATLPELEVIAASVPARYKLMVLLAGWCALRFGELAVLRRADIDVKNGVVHVRRAVVNLGGDRTVKTPKSEAGRRDVNIPPHLMPIVKDHLRDHVAAKPGCADVPRRIGRPHGTVVDAARVRASPAESRTA
jgi:integrase